MTFVQEHTIEEKYYGTTMVRFVLSDNYDDLFKDNDTLATDRGLSPEQFVEQYGVDIFGLGSIRKKIKLEENNYVIGELEISIAHYACKNTKSENAMFFALDSTNIDKNRFCALFFIVPADAGLPLLDNMEFVGKLSSNISASDETWAGDKYTIRRDPKRVYDLNAYSFDAKMLERVKLTGEIKDEYGEEIKNIEDRITEDWSQALALCKWYVNYALGTHPIYKPNVKLFPLANLREVVLFILSLTKKVLYDPVEKSILDTEINFTLDASELGIEVGHLYYEMTEKVYGSNVYIGYVSQVYYDSESRIKLSLAENPGAGYSNPYIHRRMLHPGMGLDADNLKDKSFDMRSQEKEFSFMGCDNVAKLLSEIALSFACYVMPEFISADTIKLSIIPYSKFKEESFIYISDTISASIEIASIAEEEKLNYYGLANQFAVDGADYIGTKNSTDFRVDESNTKKALEKKNKELKDKKNIESVRFLLTTSGTMEFVNYDGLFSFPLNSFLHYLSSDYDPINDTGIDIYEKNNLAHHLEKTEIIHTAIYVETKPKSDFQKGLLGDNFELHRPAYYVYANDGDDNIEKTTLSSLVNFLINRSKKYYKNEYDIEIPFLNCFAEDETGANPSWKNVQLRKKVKIQEAVKRYISGSFQEVIPAGEYIIEEYERNLTEPLTKIKLVNVDKYAFGYWEAPPEPSIPDPTEYPQEKIPGLIEYLPVSEFIFIYESGVKMVKGNAVRLNEDDGCVYLSESNNQYYNQTVGILLDDCERGQRVRVQIAHKVYCEDYNFDLTKQVFARTQAYYGYYGFLGTDVLNITQDISDIPNDKDDLIIYLGIPVTENDFILDKFEFPFIDDE